MSETHSPRLLLKGFVHSHGKWINPEFWHGGSVSATKTVKTPPRTVRSFLFQTQALTGNSHMNVELKINKRNGQLFVSGRLQTHQRPPGCRPPPRWTPRGDQGSWPGPGLWVHHGRKCLRAENAYKTRTRFHQSRKNGSDQVCGLPSLTET